MRRPCWRNGFVEPEESKGKDDKMSEHPTIEEVYKRPEYFDAVWSKSIEYYGVTKQSVVCMEECAELIEAYDDRKRDGLTDGTRSHMVEEMADVLICLWLLEHMYDIKGCDNRTRHPSPVGAGAALIKAVSKILRYNTEKERLDGLADAAEDVRRWVMRLEKRKRHHGRGTRRMGGTQDSQTTAADGGRRVNARTETLAEVIDWLGDEADREWERAKDGLSDGYDGFDAYTRAIQHCQDMLMDDTAEHGKPDEGGKMNKQNETVLLEHLADTFETKLRKADRSIGTDIPDPYREGRMDALGWAATYCRLLAERK